MNQYKVEIVNKKPVLEDANGHLRMLAGYRDKLGEYHIFCDYIHDKYNTVHSFQAVIKYYKGKKLSNLKDMGILIDKDSYGVGSPGVAIFKNRVYVFYSKRGNLKKFDKFNSLAKPGEKGYISSDLYVNIYNMNKNCTIDTKEVKTYEVLKRDNDWKSMRVDDPYPIVIKDKLYVYYKGFNDNLKKESICIAYGIFHNNKINEQKIILKKQEGFEMPRMFLDNGQLNMFVRTFNTEKSAFRHYVKVQDNFIEQDYDFFDGHPIKKASDVYFLIDYKGELTNDVLACGFEKGKLKQWLYRLSKK